MTNADDPWDAWRKRMGAGDMPDFFADFEREFARMRGMMAKIMDDAVKHASGPRRHEPFVYGFSLRIDESGTPHLQPFGDKALPVGPTAEIEAGREPLTDVIEGETETTVTVELPGVDKGDIHLHVADHAVTVRVEKGRRYHKRIELPSKVIAGSAKATYKNGVLDVVIQRAQGNGAGARVNID